MKAILILTWIVRIITGIICIFGGIILQIILWKTEKKSYFAAIISHREMWIFYIFVSLFIGEHIARLIGKTIDNHKK
jgi:hypothetical protein